MKTVSVWVLCLPLWTGDMLGQSAPLVDAAWRADITRVRSLLASGANPNEADNSGSWGTKAWTPLMAAAKAGAADVAEALLKAHASVNATNERGETALDIAFLNEKSTVASLIKAAGGKSTATAASTLPAPVQAAAVPPAAKQSAAATAIPSIGMPQTPKTNVAGSSKSTQAPAQAQPLTKIDITKWKVNLISSVHAQSVPAYFPLDDDAASSVIEIASGANKREVSYVALVRHEQDAPVGFVGGQLGQATDGLIVINIGLSNADDKPVGFLVGDIALVRANGQRLPVVAVSKWDSPLITKLSGKSVAASLTAPVTVNAGKGFRLNYCFAVVPNSFPLTLQFGSAKTDIVLKDFEALVPPKEEGGGFSVSLAGAISIGADVPLEKYEASAKGEPLVRFESLVELKKGDRLAASGPRSMDTVSVNGEEIPLLAIHDGDGYFAGKLSILSPITPIKRSASVASHEVTFASSFQAQQGDVLSATTTEIGDGWHSAVSRRTAK